MKASKYIKKLQRQLKMEEYEEPFREFASTDTSPYDSTADYLRYKLECANECLSKFTVTEKPKIKRERRLTKFYTKDTFAYMAV